MAYALSKLYVEGLVRALVGRRRRRRARSSACTTPTVRASGRPGSSRGSRRLHAGTPFTLTGAPSLADPVHVAEVVRCLFAAAGGSQTYPDLAGGDPVRSRTIARIARALGFGRRR